MYTYQILIEYDGSNFVGWQIQKNGISVQEILEKALGKLLKKRVNIYGSGRTDSGVHAFEQSAHFKVEQIIKYHFHVNNVTFHYCNYNSISNASNWGENPCAVFNCTSLYSNNNSISCNFS